MNIRAKAAKVIFEVIENGRSLTDALAEYEKTIRDPRDKSLLQAMCFGVCRWAHRLDDIAQLLLAKPLKDKDHDVYFLLLVGLYQLMDMRVPNYAAVSETVDAVDTLKKPWAKGLINGVLREYQRNTEKFAEVGLASHPEWMIHRIQQDYPNSWEDILLANNQHPPLALRVNIQQITREKYLDRLESAKIIPETHAGIFLDEAVDVSQLPGFREGEVSVQDGAAQLAVQLLQLQGDERVLDACAAPGGKTAAMLEAYPALQCVAVDQDTFRLARIKENLKRLKLHATCIAADVGDTTTWWDGELFDRILLDAPCTASGVIRRHPDIKILRELDDISARAHEQARLLKSVWQTLKPGGHLVYATCSIFQEENAQVVEHFLKNEASAESMTITADWGSACSFGRQILPGQHGMDGFYYACIRKLEIG